MKWHYVSVESKDEEPANGAKKQSEVAMRDETWRKAKGKTKPTSHGMLTINPTELED